MSVSDSSSAIRYVLDPLLTLLPLAGWEGVTWGDLHPAARMKVPMAGVDVAVARQMGGNFCVAATLRAPSNGESTVLEQDMWHAFTAWLAWGEEVARALKHRAPPADWFVLSTYPGVPYQIPEAWVHAARANPALTWGQWKNYTRLAQMGALRLDNETLARGFQLEQAKSAGALAHLATGRPSSRLSYSAQHEIPEAWLPALRRLTAGLTPGSASTYRSCVKRVVAETRTGPGTPDLDLCAATAARLGSTYRSVWRRFQEELSFGTDGAAFNNVLGHENGRFRVALTVIPHGRARVFDALESKAIKASRRAP